MTRADLARAADLLAEVVAILRAASATTTITTEAACDHSAPARAREPVSSADVRSTRYSYGEPLDPRLRAASRRPIKPSGKHPTPAHLRILCAQARAKGLEVFPPCDNVDERGRCLGHPERDQA